MIPEYSFSSTNSFHIADTLRRSNLNRSGSRRWFANIKVDNTQILALKMIFFSYLLTARLAIQRTWRLLKFRAKKREVLYPLSLFDSQKDLDCFFQPVALGKYLFVTQIESGAWYHFAILLKANHQFLDGRKIMECGDGVVIRFEVIAPTNNTPSQWVNLNIESIYWY